MYVFKIKYNYPDVGGAVVSAHSSEQAISILENWWRNNTSHSLDIPSFTENNVKLIQGLEDTMGFRVISNVRSISR